MARPRAWTPCAPPAGCSCRSASAPQGGRRRDRRPRACSASSSCRRSISSSGSTGPWYENGIHLSGVYLSEVLSRTFGRYLPQSRVEYAPRVKPCQERGGCGRPRRRPRCPPPALLHLGLLGFLVGRVDAGEAVQLARRAPCAYRPFGSRRSHTSTRRVDEDLDERQTGGVVQPRAPLRDRRRAGETSDTTATTPASANSRATSPTRRMFSARRRARSRGRRTGRGGRCRRRAGRRCGPRRRARARGHGDRPLARAGRPVSHTVAPRWPSASRALASGRPGCQVTSRLWRVGARASRAVARSAPAPTVSLVRSSMRMNAPVSRLSAYGSASTRRAGAQGERADVVEAELERARTRASSVYGVEEAVVDRLGRWPLPCAWCA